MTDKQKAEVARRSGWPSRGNPYQQQDEADLYEEVLQQALKDGKK